MHLRHIRWLGVILGVSSIATIATVWAQTGGGYDASYNAFTGGGTTMSSGGYVLQTGVGQPMAGEMGNGSYSLNIGVVAGGEGAAAAGSPVASPSASPSVSASPSPTGTPFPYKRFGPQVAKDGVN